MNAEVYEYWTAENTGWSGGSSWFPCERDGRIPVTYKSEDEACEAIAVFRKSHGKGQNMRYRIGHHRDQRAYTEIACPA
jgi:hypothetical protein